VVINPGLGFGTGLHPTTRGTLHLLQNPGNLDGSAQPLLGPLVDAGTGSGILAIAAAKLGWGPVFAFDNDPVALVSARENIVANGVGGIVEVHQTDVAGASPYWFAGATVLANMTLEPVVALVRRLAPDQGSWGRMGSPASGPTRLVVSGILEGAQERELAGVARLCGFVQGRRMQEAEWVSVELLPVRPAGSADDWPPLAFGS
jgi:ribosomal protein L11 methyltransferase